MEIFKMSAFIKYYFFKSDRITPLKSNNFLFIKKDCLDLQKKSNSKPFMSSVFQHKIPFPKPAIPKDITLEKSKDLAKNTAEKAENAIPQIAILILAAGNSSRLGQPKQLIEFNEKPLICHIIEQALFVKMHSVFVVLGGNKSAILPKIGHLPVTMIDNKNWKDGMGSSIAVGVKKIQEKNPKTTGIVTLLCDQPFVSADLIYQIITQQQKTNAKIVASKYAGHLGVPAYFSQPIFSELLSLKGQAGAKKVIQQHLSVTKFVSFPEGIFDIDVPEDLVRIEEWAKILEKKNKFPLNE